MPVLLKPLPAIDLVVVGASAGGVEALLAIFALLPATCRVPIVTVLHLPDDGISQLAEIFARRSRLVCKEVADKEPLKAGVLYFAAPGYHVSIEQDRSLSLSREEPVHFSRPSIDFLFESAADVYGARLAAVLLTGANYDGARGMLRVKEQGGFTVVQDPQQAQVRTMPEAALALHTPNCILPLNDIAQLLVELERTPC